MPKSSNVACATLAALAIASTFSSHALAQAYPQRTITLINPSAAGGGNEVVKAVVFDRVATALGVPIIMESKGGGGGTIAASYVARADPDGYTLLLAGASIVATNPATHQALPYDPVRDFTPIATLTDAPLLLVVHKSVPATDVREFVSYARAAPDRVDYGSYGPGSTSFLAFELFRTVAGIDAVHVPYRGGGPLLIALLTGQVQASFDFLPQVRHHHESGALRVLGIAAAKRSSLAPDVPTLAEQGYPMEASGPLVLMAPAGLPPAIAERLNVEINHVLALPEVRQRLVEVGYEVIGGTRQQAAAKVVTDLAKWKKLVTDIRLELQ